MAEKVWRWNPKQSEALLSRAPYVDLEGGTGAGKTTPLVGKVSQLVVEHPGIHCLLYRWTEDALNTQLKPAWRDFARESGLELSWNAEQEYDEVLGTDGGVSGHNSRVYLRGLKTSQEVAKYQKLRGLNLAFVGGDQVEELPEDYFIELIARLRQIGYPKQMWIVAQPVPHGHWIERRFPEDNRDPSYHYIRTNAYDNIEILGPDYLRKLEEAFPLGTPERRTLLEGRRGLTVQGDAVYKGYFNRAIHERMVLMNPELPLIQSLDFGHHHPCLSFHQVTPYGEWIVLGAVMGRDLYLEDFIPMALQMRSQWFGVPMSVMTTGDPAGAAASSQGLSQTVADILAAHGVEFSCVPGANAPEIRYQAIQTASKFMRRRAMNGAEGFTICPRQVEVSATGRREIMFATDGLEAGYVWDTRVLTGANTKTIRVPKKDGVYDHFQNTLEYAMLAFAPVDVTQQSVEKAERSALRRAQQDEDADDPRPRRARGYSRR